MFLVLLNVNKTKIIKKKKFKTLFRDQKPKTFENGIF